MKKIIFLLLLLFSLLTGCREEKWHPDSTEVVFDTQLLTVEKLYEDTDLGSGEMDYYTVKATATADTAPFYNLTMTALIGVQYYPGQYTNSRDEEYSGYVIKEISDVQFYGGGENMQWIPLGDTGVFTEIQPGEDTMVLWGNGYYQAVHDKKVKNIFDYLPGKFLDIDTTVKEYFTTQTVSMFVKLYVEEIITCSPADYHLTAKSTGEGVATFG